MKLCFLFVVVVVLWTKQGETKRTKDENSARKRNKIVRKQHVPGAVPSNTKKQYIDNYGGGSLGNVGYESEMQQNDAGEGGTGLSAQAGMGNTLQGAGLSLDSGLSQDGSDMMSTLKGGNEFDPMSNDLVDPSESTESRQLQIGNGFGQGGGAGSDAMFAAPSTSDNSLSASAGTEGGFIDGMSTGLGGGSLGGGAVQEASLAGALGGTGGGSIGGGTGGGHMDALSDGMGADLGGAGGSMGGLSASLGGVGGIEGGGSIGGGSIGGGGIGGGGIGGGGIGGGGIGGGGIGGGGIGGGGIGGGGIGGGGIGGGSIGGGGIGGGSIGGGSIGGGGIGGNSIEGGSIGGGSIGGGGIGGSSIKGGSVGGGGIGGGSIGGDTIGGGVGGGLGEIGGGLGDGGGLSAGDLGGDGGDGGVLGSLAGLGGANDASIDGGMGLGGLGSHLSGGGGKQIGMDDLGGLGGSLGSHMDLAGFGGSGPGLHGAGHMSGLATAPSSSEDSQLSDAVDETPSAMHPGLTSILPGKTVHAHVSDKPSSNRPAVTGPSMSAALQVQKEAQKQHQVRLQALKLKLKKLREKLEQLQLSSKKHETVSASQEQDNAELDTLNDLKKATQDAIKELNTDYLHVKKHQSVVAAKHETLGTKLKTVDFTAKETGDTLEELLKLLDPELQDKKRGQVDGKKISNTRLDDEAENKLASLTKKAEDEVDKLASQNPKQKPVIKEKVSDGNSSAMKAVVKAPAHWKGVPSQKSKIKTALLNLGETSSTHDKKNLRVPIQKSKLKKALLKLDKKTKNSAQEKKKLKYTKIGCWRDDPTRVVPSLENTSPLLESGYRVRDSSIKKCAQVAKEQGFDGFAIENGGQCFSGPKLLKRYKMYGKSNDCANDGKGGDYAMDVYKFAD